MKSIRVKFQEIAGEKKFVAKIVCIFLAVALWAFITNSKTGTVRFKVPIKERHLPSFGVVSEMSKDSVIVTFEGKKDIIKNLNIKNINAYVDLSKPKIGKKHKYKILIEKQHLPEGINIYLSFKYINVLVERKLDKRIYVIVRKVGNAKQGFVVGRITVLPEKIRISGPKNIVDKINYIYTDEISIEGEDKTIEKIVSISNDFKEKITIHETNVKVIIPIVEYRNLNEIKTPIVIKNSKKGFVYSINEKVVVVFYKTEGDLGVKENPGIKLFDAIVDVENIDVSSLLTEEKDEIKEVITEEVTVLIKNKGDLKKGEIISYKPDKVTVTVKLNK